MKNTIKLFFVVVLFCSTVFADGNMGNGGFAGDGNMGNGGFTGDGNMGNGGKTCTTNCFAGADPTATEKNVNETDDNSAMISFIQDYLASIFG